MPFSPAKPKLAYQLTFEGSWPTAVACWDGGVFVVATPDLYYFKDTDGDGVADVKRLIFTGFGALTEKYNVQTLPNSLQWGPDQRIHLALGGIPSKLQNMAVPSAATLENRSGDLSFDPRKLDPREPDPEGAPGGRVRGLPVEVRRVRGEGPHRAPGRRGRAGAVR